jgi:hypothetical protein
MKIIATAAGTLDLVPASADQLRGIARYWPMELVTTTDDPERFALVFQRGEQEIHGIMLQPPDASEPAAVLMHQSNRNLIAAALPHYLAKQHHGVMIPGAYYKEKAEGRVETGFVLFVGPDPQSQPQVAAGVQTLYDDRLGPGATAMVLDMVTAIATASRERQLPLMAFVGMELQPRLAVGGLAMHFVVQGGQVFAIKDPVEEEDPVWEQVVLAGFSSILYAPLWRAALPSAPPTETPQI